MMKQHGVAFAVFAIAWAVWGAWRTSARRGGVIRRAGLRRRRRWRRRLAIVLRRRSRGRACSGASGSGRFSTRPRTSRRCRCPLRTTCSRWPGATSPRRMGRSGTPRRRPGAPLRAALDAREPRRDQGWLLAAALAIVPGFFFRPHYFIVLMPVAGLLVGVAIAAHRPARSRAVGAAGRALAAGALRRACGRVRGARNAHYLFSMTPTSWCERCTRPTRSSEVAEIGRYIRDAHTPDDRIVVLGSEPQIFFYAGPRVGDRLHLYISAHGEPAVRRRGCRKNSAGRWRAARPAYLVFVGVPSVVGNVAGSPTRGSLTWANEFTARCYELAGIADIDPGGRRQDPLGYGRPHVPAAVSLPGLDVQTQSWRGLRSLPSRPCAGARLIQE